MTSQIPSVAPYNNIYHGFGVLLKADNSSITGYGHVTVTYVRTTKVRIEFGLCITANSNTSSTNYFKYGISAAQVKSLTSFPSTITPISYEGWWACPSASYNQRSIYGAGASFFNRDSKYWGFGRYYDSSGSWGDWPAYLWAAGSIGADGTGTFLYGVCYGSI